MDRRTARNIRQVAKSTGKSQKSMKKFFNSLSQREKHQMRREMERFISVQVQVDDVKS